MIYMKRCNKLIMSVVALMTSSLAFGQTDIDKCIELAYQNYPQIMEYELIDASRKYDVSNAAMAWIPQLSVSGKAQWQSEVVEMPFDVPGMQLDIPHDQYGLTADITQQIWDGGSSIVKKKLANAGADVKKRQLDVNLYAIRSRVQNIYLGIKLIDSQLELNKLLEESLERTQKEIEAMLDNGIAYGSDLNQIKVSILANEQQRQALVTDRNAYVRMLGLLTGTDLSNESFTDPTVTVPSENADVISRPELALYDAQEKQISLQRQQLNVNLSPKLNFNLQAGYGRPGLNMLSGQFSPYLIAGVKLQWNIGNLYTLRNDRRKSDSEAAKVDLARKSFMMNTSMEAIQKRGEMEKAADVMSRDEEIIRLRSSIRESAELQYKEGVMKMNDYLGMLDEEFKARVNSSVHYIQYLMAVYDLQNTLGSNNE